MANRNEVTATLIAVLILGGGIDPAVAQVGTQTEREVRDDTEIVVTAQKREERLIDIPLSITAVDADFIESRNINSLEDVARFVPNTRFDFGQGSQSDNRVTIRGLTSAAGNAQPGIDPNVAFYLDGVYLQRPEQLNPELIDIERLEVLRGPQGTLYGKNSTVGAVNVITRIPSLIEASGLIDAQYGNYDSVRLRGRFEIPLVLDRVALSLSGFFTDNSGLRRNSVDGAAVADLRRYGFRGKLYAEPTESLSITLSGDYQSDRTNSSIGDLLIVGFDPAFLFLPAPLPSPTPGNVFDKTVSKTPNAEKNRVENWGSALSISYDTGPATITSLTGYRGFKTLNFLDLDFSAEPYFRSGRDNKQSQFSEELRLVSNGDNKLDWLVGLFLYKADLESDLQTNVDDAALLGLPAFFGGVQQLAPTDLEVESQAIFGQLGYRATDNLTLRLGLRLDRESRNLLTAQTVGTLFGGLAGFQSFSPTRFARVEKDLALMGSVTYEIGRDFNVYATYSEGAKSGGFNGGGLSGSATSLDPARLEFGKEAATNYEAGLKFRLPEHRANFALSVFRIDFTDLQVTVFDAPEIRTTNAARASSEGVEFEASAELDRFSLLTSIGYNHAKYKDYTNGPLPGGTFGDRSGDTLANAPRWQLAGSAYYSIATGTDLDLTAGVDAIYTSAQNLDSTGDPVCRQKGYALLNGSLAAKIPDQGLEFQLWARNLTDNKYLVNCGLIGSVLAGGPGFNRLVGTYLGTPGSPRTFGALVRYRF